MRYSPMKTGRDVNLKGVFKPQALRFPYLMVFLSIFLVSIGLIEKLFSISAKDPSNPSRQIIKPNGSDAQYLVMVFLAPAITVFLKILFEGIISSMKLMDPIHQLSRANGACAQKTILSRYLRSTMSTDLISYTTSGQLLPLWSAVMFTLVAVMPAVSSGSLSLENKGWVLNTAALRTLEGLLVASVLLVILYTVWTWNYKSSIRCNPSSIAWVASVIQDEPTRNLMLGLDTNADDKDLARYFSAYDFQLDNAALVGCKKRSREQRVPDKKSRITSNLKSIIIDVICLLTLVAQIAVLASYYAIPPDYDNLYNTNPFWNFWYPFLLTGVSTLADLQFKNIERIIRVTEPYRRLRNKGRNEVTIALTRNGTCWSNLPFCMYYLIKGNGDMAWQTIVTVVACLADVNIVLLAGGTWSSDRSAIWIFYWSDLVRYAQGITSIATFVIAGTMIITMLVHMIWWRNVAIIKQMPYVPETIGAVMCYLNGMSSAQGELKELAAKGRDLTFGNIVCVEGRRRWAIGLVGREVDDLELEGIVSDNRQIGDGARQSTETETKTSGILVVTTATQSVPCVSTET